MLPIGIYAFPCACWSVHLSEFIELMLNGSRLYLQHWMWRRNFGYLLHPKVPIEKDKDINIIDVACGTG